MRTEIKAFCDACGKPFNEDRKPIFVANFHVVLCPECDEELALADAKFHTLKDALASA